MGKKRHPFFGELRRESQWGRCFPIATKGCSQTTLHLCFRRALTQFPSLYSSKYLIYCCVTFPSAKAKMRNGFKAGLKYLFSLYKSGRVGFNTVLKVKQPLISYLLSWHGQCLTMCQQVLWAGGIRHLKLATVQSS